MFRQHQIFAVFMRRCVIPAIAVFLTAIGSCQNVNTSSKIQVSDNTQNKPRSPTIWRNTNADAANCLFVLLKYHGVNISYRRIEHALTLKNRANGKTSLLDLKGVASEFGLKLTVVRCSPGLDAFSRLPAITLLEIPQADSAEFVILFNRNIQTEYVYLVHGGSATFNRIPYDDFRRNWAGVLLTVDANTMVNKEYWSPRHTFWASSLIFVLGFAVWRAKVFIQCKRRTKYDTGS